MTGEAAESVNRKQKVAIPSPDVAGGRHRWQCQRRLSLWEARRRLTRCLEFLSLRGGEGVRDRSWGCEVSFVVNLCTASDSAVTWAARDSIVTAGVAVAADTVANVGALAAIIASTSGSSRRSDTSRICRILAGNRLRKRVHIMSGGNVVPVQLRRR